MLVSELNNNRSKKQSWMRNEWKWHIIFIDAFSITCPKYARVQVFGYTWLPNTVIHISKGSNDEPNGPPSK